MAKNFNELRQKMSSERRQHNEARAKEELLEMSLQELRQNITSFSQGDIAEMLEVTQGPLCQRRVRQLPLEISVLTGGESSHDRAQASACS